MSDSFVEFSSKGWFTRLRESIGSVLVGLFLFAVSFPVLFFNEGRAVRTARSLDEGAGAVVSIESGSMDPGNNGRLVHLQGEARTDETLRDAEFGVSAPALRLRRRVEMYQWNEHKRERKEKQVGGREDKVTVYEYETKWHDTHIASGRFKRSAEHSNPPFPWHSQEWTAAKATLGVFQIPPSLLKRINREEALPPEPSMLANLPSAARGRATIHDGAIYIGKDPLHPVVGDVRVHFTVVRPTEVSVVAAQQGALLGPWKAAAGDDVELLQVGRVAAERMFESAQSKNSALTWVLRFLGWLLMFLGVTLMFRPLVVVADVIPILGSLLGFGAAMFGFAVASALSTVTVAVGWIVYRPLLGVLMLVVGVVVFVMFAGWTHRRKTLARVGR